MKFKNHIHYKFISKYLSFKKYYQKFIFNPIPLLFLSFYLCIELIV